MHNFPDSLWCDLPFPYVHMPGPEMMIFQYLLLLLWSEGETEGETKCEPQKTIRFCSTSSVLVLHVLSIKTNYVVIQSMNPYWTERY